MWSTIVIVKTIVMIHAVKFKVLYNRVGVEAVFSKKVALSLRTEGWFHKQRLCMLYFSLFFYYSHKTQVLGTFKYLQEVQNG